LHDAKERVENRGYNFSLRGYKFSLSLLIRMRRAAILEKGLQDIEAGRPDGSME